MSIHDFIQSLREKLNLPRSGKETDNSEILRAEKTFVFVLSFVIALGLWMLINLGREFAVTIQLPLTYGEFPENKAPLQPLPDYTNATFSGEGWKLLSIYGNPPRISVNPDEESTNIYDAIQIQLATGQDINLNRAEPSVIRIQMEEAMSVTVPVQSNIEMNFRGQFGTIGTPVMSPDSVIVFGARSLVQSIDSWPTRKTIFDNLDQSFTASVSLEDSNELIRLSHNSVRFNAEVAEFTEGEVRIPIEITGGEGRPRIILNPANISVRYNVPVSQYARAQDQSLIRAVVSYTDIEQDDTGYIVPDFVLQDDSFDISVRSYTPRRTSYFRLIEE